MTGSVSRAQPRRQQASGVALEDQQGVIHVLVVGAVEKAELLLAMGGIIGGIDIQQDLTALADLLAAQTQELFQQSVIQEHQIAGGRRIFPAAEGGLGAERLAQGLIGDDLQQRVVAQAVGIVGIFVSGNDLIEALPQQCQRVVLEAMALTRIAEELGQITGQVMALIEGAQRQKTGVAGDLSAGKISLNGLLSVEGEKQLWYTVCHVVDAPKGSAGFTKTQCSSTF